MKVKYDVSGSDPEAAQGREQPQPGVYPAKVVELKVGAKKDDPEAKRLEVTYEISGGKYKGSRLWDYLSFSEAAQWKLDQFLQAVGVTTKTRRKGTLDTDELIGTLVKIRVVGDTYNGEYRGRVGSVLSGEDIDESEFEEEDGGEEESSEEEDLETLGANADEEGDDGEAAGRLTELAEEAGLDVNDYDTWSELATVLAEDNGGDEGESDGEGEEEDLAALGEQADADDEESAERLTELAKEADLDPDEYGTWAELAEALQGSGEGEAPDDEYDDMALKDLRAECEERGIASNGARAAVIKRLRENDQEETPF